MADETTAFLGRVLEAFPRLRPVYEVTLAECQAQGLPDVAPTDLLRKHTVSLIDRFVVNHEAARAELASFLQLLDREYGTSIEVDDMIGDGVLTMLPSAEDEPDVFALLGPKLTAAVNKERTWRARPHDMALVTRLVKAVPALAPLATENAYGDHGDTLVYMFLGDVAFREVDNVRQGRFEEVRAVLAVLETELTADPEDPVALGFVENLPYPHEPGAEIVELLGPRLRDDLHGQRRGLYT